MSAAFQITIPQDTATPAMDALIAKLAPVRIATIIGPHLKNQVQNHLLANGRNKRNWPTTFFWARAAKATSWFHDGAGTTTIRIDQQGVRQRWKGGRITPQSARMLTIPISPEAYGKRASEFPGAFLLKTKKGAYIVQRGTTVTAAGTVKAFVGAKKRGFASNRVVASLEFLFKLSAGVDQKPNPAALPTEAALTGAAVARLKEALLPK